MSSDTTFSENSRQSEVSIPADLISFTDAPAGTTLFMHSVILDVLFCLAQVSSTGMCWVRCTSQRLQQLMRTVNETFFYGRTVVCVNFPRGAFWVPSVARMCWFTRSNSFTVDGAGFAARPCGIHFEKVLGK